MTSRGSLAQSQDGAIHEMYEIKWSCGNFDSEEHLSCFRVGARL